ncbi:MAG: glycosyltransferase family 4 protein [Actinobacteria bacterium]|nr:glycosyltransferase family 4 protein [Actinomycetota bacterium]
MRKQNPRLKILTWHVHGNYLYYLTQIKSCDFYIPYPPLGNGFDWGENVYQIPQDEIKNIDLDLILFQSNYPLSKQSFEGQYQILTPNQQVLPKIYLEHDPPREHPTNTQHLFKDSNIILVHVTHFNNLMWDSGNTKTWIIEHGVIIPQRITFKGDIKKGVVVINNLQSRGRRLGLDIFETVRSKIPLDLFGINSERLDGFGELPHNKLAEVLSHYRFFFYPVRYTSLGLSLCEAMTLGMPIVALAATETVTVVKNGVNGFIDTDPIKLISYMKKLLGDADYAKTLGKNAKSYAKKRFSIKRFTDAWEKLFSLYTKKSLPSSNKPLRENLSKTATISL